ncbi:ABC-type bacteriocin/lantibiotic exporter with double-glycine peptidase domain [Halospina denitrificans]|uniref:ABC-type bacteriocin/lantibiotic exporter with double-glycine peptidase domain n=1 Tax=Halospina denitrificans TaxID=332522 RepID=A0A4R7K1S8_9GAMM|nr:ABC transporter ATP-binding protein [Halospina denitrificans]TDT43459.1 ABC-type bacteriocin/lantibiotic exporter with double-glycine peptidase domain [Halospina denitrificans]
MTTFRKILALLSPKERRRGALVMAMVILMAIMETVGVAAIMPFLSVMGDPEAVENTPYLLATYNFFGFQSKQGFLMALGIGAFCIVLIGAAVRIVTTYAINRYAQMRRHSVGERLLETYLRQPYAFFLNRHSGDMAKSILSEVDQLIMNVIKPGFDAIAYSVVALAIILFLIIQDPWLALGVGVVIGGSYLMIFGVVQKHLTKIGKERAISNKERFTAAGEALGGIKDIKLLGREQAYLTRFRPSSARFSRHQATNATLAEVPRYFIEAIGVGGVIVLALLLMARNDNVGQALPVLGLYAFAGYKLLPAAQRIYQGFAKLRFGAAAVDEIYSDLSEREALAEIRNLPNDRLEANNAITLNNLSFTYPAADTPALNSINLTVPVGSAIGLVGGTGAGKTTLVDLILGLLRPTEGQLEVDDTPITDENLRQWQASLGYVPQDIFLVDATVAENIALGIPKAKIDHQKVEECARMAQVHEFIINQMPQQYETEVGERGVRLSGGQRQRIGIARALYHDPAILVFDEATSALDNATEKAVMDAVNALSHDKTIIMIAHRLSTVEKCDQIVLLEQGGITAKGTYNELLNNSAAFQKMAV